MSKQDIPNDMAATVVREWREANEWPGLVWSAQILSDEPKWRAAWTDLETRVTDALRAHEQAVRAEERERCARICDSAEPPEYEYGLMESGWEDAKVYLSERRRGTQRILSTRPRTLREAGGKVMAKFRKKPVVIEAEQFYGARMGQDTLEWIQGFPKGVCFKGCSGSKHPHLHTIHEGQVVDLVDGDWVISESDGEHFYPCKPDIFATTYEPVEDNPNAD